MIVATALNDLWSEFAMTKGEEVRAELVTAYIPLLHVVTDRLGLLAASLLMKSDLEHYGMVGLGRAIDSYHPRAGIGFEAFAPSYIRGAIIEEECKQSWLLRSLAARVRQIEGALVDSGQDQKGPAKEAEIAARLEVSPDEYRQMLLEASILILALDIPLAALPVEEEETSLRDLLEGRTMQEVGRPGQRGALVALVSAALARLPISERLVLSLYYRDKLALQEICNIMAIAFARGYQLHVQGVLRLRAILNSGQESMPQAELSGERERVKVAQSVPGGKGTARRL